MRTPARWSPSRTQPCGKSLALSDLIEIVNLCQPETPENQSAFAHDIKSMNENPGQVVTIQDSTMWEIIGALRSDRDRKSLSTRNPRKPIRLRPRHQEHE